MDSALDTGIPSAVETAFGEAAGAARFETTEPVRAVRQLVPVYGPHDLQVGGDGLFGATMRSFELGQLHVAHIRYGAPVVMSMDRPHANWVFSYLRAGRVTRTRTGDEFLAGSAGVGSPEAVDQLVMSADAELVNLRVDEDDMRAACRTLLGSDLAERLRFEDRAEAGSREVHTFMRVVRHLASTPRLTHPGARRYENSVRDAALFELLLGWPNNAAAVSSARAALPSSTQRARDYIHAHAAEAPTVAEIATAAGVGVRALALGFDRHVGMSPLRYLMQVRLDGARGQLRTAPPGETVTRVAYEWGFTNPGVFAARYRERFGEAPSETLRQRVA